MSHRYIWLIAAAEFTNQRPFQESLYISSPYNFISVRTNAAESNPIRRPAIDNFIIRCICSQFLIKELRFFSQSAQFVPVIQLSHSKMG